MTTDEFFKHTTLPLTGDVGLDGLEYIHRYGQDQLKRSKDERDEAVTVLISSLGGSTAGGLAGRDMLRLLNKVVRVNVVAVGVCHSAAVSVLLSVPAEQRFATPETSFLIHQPHRNYSLQVQGSHEAQEALLLEEIQDLKFGKSLLDTTVRIVSRPHTKLSEEKVRELMRYGTLFDSRQALEWGFIGGLLEI